MAVVRQTDTKQEQLIERLDQYGNQLEDLRTSVQEINNKLDGNRNFIVRAVKQWLSFVDPNWKNK